MAKKPWGIIEALWLSLAALAPAAIFVVLIKFAVNAPYWDDWALVQILHHWNDGSFRFSEVFAQHNEHRIVFPQLLMLAMAGPSRYDLRAEMFAGLGIALITFVVLAYQLWKTWPFEQRTVWPFGALTCWIFFSASQSQNWLWGWQIQWFMNVFGAVTAASGLAKFIAEKQVAGLWLAMAGATFATFCLGSGVAAWPVGLAILLMNRCGWKGPMVWSAVAAAELSVYMIGFQKSPLPSRDLIGVHPANVFTYFFAYVGRPLRGGVAQAIPTGLLITLLFLACLGWMVFRHREAFGRLTPWIFLGGYSLCSAAMTALSRAPLGIDQAMSSRYITLSSLLLIGLFPIGAAVASEIIGMNRALTWAQAVAALAVLLLFGTYRAGIVEIQTQSAKLRSIAACVHHASGPNDGCLALGYPDLPAEWGFVQYLRSIHWDGDAGGEK